MAVTLDREERFAPRIGIRQVYRLWRVVVLALIVTVLAILSPGSFFTLSNLINILRQASVPMLLALGMLVVILTGGIDLSVGNVMTLAGIAGASVLKAQVPWPLGLLAGAGLGLLTGMANGAMVAGIGLPAFVATYGTMWIASGLAVVFLGGYIIYDFDPAFRFLGTGYVFGIPTPVIVMLAFVGLGWFFLNRTTMGRNIYAVGANVDAARLSGIDVKKTLLIAYTISGFFAGLGGMVAVARLNAAEAGLGEQLLLPTVAAVVVGGASMSGGEGTVLGTLFGVLVLTLISNGMNLLGVSAIWQAPLQGTVIVLAVVMNQWGHRASEREQAEASGG